MFLIEMPILFFGMAFLVGLLFMVFGIKDKFKGNDVDFSVPLTLIFGSIVLSSFWILVVKYTFIEGIIMQCSEIEFFCK
tara:strand:- start:366 stop:602 length:237 start_codon:yes stop_codon:yes gene_type:complete